MKIISVREQPEYKDMILKYIQSKWASENTMKIYENCIEHCLKTQQPLPQWYVLMDDDKPIGCAGLITNDFISRMDLYPWVCAVFVDEAYRGHRYGELLLNKAKEDALGGGFTTLNLCTEHIGYYEKFGFEYIGDGYHPWGASTRIYQVKL